MSKGIKVKEQIGSEIKVKDKVAMRTKPAMRLSAKTLKTGVYMTAASMLSVGIDAADPQAKETARKYKDEIAMATELKHEARRLNSKLKPVKQKLRMQTEKKLFKKAVEKRLKTRTAFSPLLYRRKAYEDRYREVMQLRRKEHIRRFLHPAKKAWQKSKTGRAVRKAQTAAKEKIANVAEKQVVKQTIRWIRRLVAAARALVTAIIAAGGVVFLIPLLAALIILSAFPAFHAATDAAGNGMFASPFGKTPYTITSEFGTRIDPLTGTETQHDGYDVCAATGEGSPIFAVYDGTILSVHDGSKSETGYGSYVILRVDAGEIKEEITVLYGHLSGFVVKAGDKVQTGELIGFEGNTGKSTGSHLHFEVRLDGEPIDGKFYWDL